LQTWVVAPYKKPEKELAQNEEFNNHILMVQIRSEHAIGFLEGCFRSLKSLRIRIKDKKSHQFATYWVAACIGVHAFAMQCEADEQACSDSEDDGMADPFIAEGLLSDSDSDTNTNNFPVLQGPASGLRLRKAKA
jgi:hypothetical protein